MNCKQCQEKILESFAAGQGILAVEASRHQESCEACCEFFQAQETLFFAIDKNLRSLMNQSIPSSLLPSVRVRLKEVSLPRPLRFYAWSAAAVTAAALLTVNVGYRLRHAVNSAKPSSFASVASRNVDTPQRELPRNEKPRKSYVPTSKIRHSAPATSTAVPEVIVLTEERQAFAKFVSEVPEKPDVAQALLRSSPNESEDSVEIAQLQIDTLDVKTLEGTATE
jgi:hypothetical protein